MLSTIDATLHIHTAQPSLSAAWCGACAAMLDWHIVLADHLHAKE